MQLRKYNLDPSAAQFLGAFQLRADLTLHADEKLARESEGKKLTRADVQRIIQELVPGCDDAVEKALALVQAPRRGCNPAYATQIIGRAKVTKKFDHVVHPPRPTPPVRRDPYEMDLELDPRGKFFILASGSKFDAETGKPRLMKIVARKSGDGEPTEADKQAVAALPLGEFAMPGEPDITWIGPNVAAIKTSDINEPEFDFGSSAVILTLNKKCEEISRTTAVDPVNEQITCYFYAGPGGGIDRNRPYGAPQVAGANDTTPPETFSKKLKLFMSAREPLRDGRWIHDAGTGQQMTMKLHVGRGWLKELDGKGTVGLLGNTVETSVAKDDSFYLGSPSSTLDIPVENAWSIAQLLEEHVTTRYWRVATDQGQTDYRLADLVYPDAGKIALAGSAFTPLADVAFRKGSTDTVVATKHVPENCDPEEDAQRIRIELTDKFLSADDPARFAGWKIEAGFVDSTKPEGERWVADKPCDVPKRGFKGAKFELDLADVRAARGARIPMEIRLFNAEGVPAGRVLLPLDQIDWAAGAGGE